MRPAASEDRQKQTPVSSSGGRKPTTCSVRIVSFAVLYSDAATTATGPSGHREPGTDGMTTTQVSSVPVPPLPPSPFFTFRSCALPGAAKASVIEGLSPTPFFFPDTGCPLACRYGDTPKVPISWLPPRTPARPVLQNAHTFLPISNPRSRTRISSGAPRLQYYLHLDRVSLLVPGGAAL